VDLLGLKLLKVIQLNLSIGCYLDKALSEVAQIGGCASFRYKSLVSDTYALHFCSMETMGVFVLNNTWLAIVSWIECSFTQSHSVNLQERWMSLCLCTTRDSRLWKDAANLLIRSQLWRQSVVISQSSSTYLKGKVIFQLLSIVCTHYVYS
jgi:hypothetical protein